MLYQSVMEIETSFIVFPTEAKQAQKWGRIHLMKYRKNVGELFPFTRQFLKKWWAVKDSNLRPSD